MLPFNMTGSFKGAILEAKSTFNPIQSEIAAAVAYTLAELLP
jgi:hypothetical protein